MQEGRHARPECFVEDADRVRVARHDDQLRRHSGDAELGDEPLGLAERRDGGLVLSRRGRFLGGGVTAELMAESPAKSKI